MTTVKKNKLAERFILGISAAALVAVILGALMILAQTAEASNKKPPPPTMEMDQKQLQDQEQYQKTDVDQSLANTNVLSTSASGSGQATNEGNNTEINSRTENNSTNIVMVPNNNTESCVRVFGLAFGKDGAAGSIGFPWRAAACDFEQAGDDAFAGGERDLGWFWKCHSKNLYKPFRDKGEDAKTAINDCHNRMMNGVTSAQMITMLQEEMDKMREDHEADLASYSERMESQKGRCNESKNRIVEACRK